MKEYVELVTEGVNKMWDNIKYFIEDLPCWLLCVISFIAGVLILQFLLMKSRWEHFSKQELSCTGACPRCSGSDSNMNAEFMAKLVKLRKLCGFSFPITSAYRCPDRNKEVSKTGLNGPHTTGKAIDIQISGPEAYVLVMLAIQLNFTGIGVNQKGPHNKRFIHLDWNREGKARPRIWSY